MTDSVTDNFKSRDASASKNWCRVFVVLPSPGCSVALSPEDWEYTSPHQLVQYFQYLGPLSTRESKFWQSFMVLHYVIHFSLCKLLINGQADLKFVKWFTWPNFQAKEFFTLKTRNSWLFLAENKQRKCIIISNLVYQITM